MDKIQLVDLKAQYARIRGDVLQAIEGVLESSAFIQGKQVAELEREFTVFLGGGVRAAGCSNGTSAIELALEALGVGAGDEVITTPHTFIATAEAICRLRARPVLVDIDPTTDCIDVRQIEAAVTARTRALMPVHIHGNPCAMDAIQEIARARKLFVIEDCAQAHGAKFRGQSVGTFGDAATFSFYPGKNMGAYGDAGLVTARDEALHRKIRMLLDHGRAAGKKYEHDVIGSNQRMDEIQAAILRIKLRSLGEDNAKRRQLAVEYQKRLSGLRFNTPTPGAEPVWHHFTIQVDRRDEVAKRLGEQGVATAIHYPISLHLQPALRSLGYREGDFPIAEALARRTLSLPLYPELTIPQLERVCAAVRTSL